MAFRAKAVMAAAVAAALATGPAVAQKEKVVANNELVRIQEYPGTILNLIGWVMIDGGFCAQHKIRCEGLPIPSGPVALQALAAGSLEVTYASTEVTMQAAARGNDVQIIAGHSPDNIYELSVRADLQVPNKAAGYPAVMKDLVGKKVGVTARGAGTELLTRALFIGAGLDPESVTYVAVGSPSTAYPTMVAKQIDAALMFQPFRTLCETQRTCTVIVDMAAGEGPPGIKALNGGFETFAARREWIKTNPTVVKAFIQAVTEAIEFMQKPENYERVAEINRKRLTLGDIPNAEATMTTLLKAQIPRFGVKVERASVKAFSDFLVGNKLIERPVDPASFVYEGTP